MTDLETQVRPGLRSFDGNTYQVLEFPEVKASVLFATCNETGCKTDVSFCIGNKHFGDDRGRFLAELGSIAHTLGRRIPGPREFVEGSIAAQIRDAELS